MLQVLLFSLVTVAATAAGPAQGANRTRGPNTLSPASIPPPPIDKLAIFDLATVATAEPDSVLGVEVVAAHATVNEVVEGGFWVAAIDDDERIFVVPAEGNRIKVHPGELVTLHGEVRLRWPSALERQSPSRTLRSLIPYLYAYTIRPAWPQEKRPPIEQHEEKKNDC